MRYVIYERNENGEDTGIVHYFCEVCALTSSDGTAPHEDSDGYFCEDCGCNLDYENA